MQTRRLQRTKRTTDIAQIATRDGIGRSKQHGILSHMVNRPQQHKLRSAASQDSAFLGHRVAILAAKATSGGLHASHSKSPRATIRDASNLTLLLCNSEAEGHVGMMRLGREESGTARVIRRNVADQSRQKTIVIWF